MGSLRDFLIDVGRNAYGLGENVASLGSAAIAEPVAGYAAMFDPVNGAQAIREGMTYQPRTEAGRMYQQGAAQAVGRAVKPVIPVIDTWQKGVDIAGRYSPTLGALMQTAPTALGVALGAKPTLQAGRQASNTLGAMQARMIANANAPRTLNTGFMRQRGAIGTLSTDDDLRALAKFNQMDDVYKFDNSHEYYDPIDKLVARNLSDDSFDFMELPTSYGKITITPSAKEKGKWQVTQWAKDGLPNSDSGNLTKEKALRTFFEDSRPELLAAPKRPLTEFEQAHLTAQRNAALPVNQGGLGLAADNTAMDRARALGFEDGWAHGSPNPKITEMKPSSTGAEGPGTYATNYLPEASTYSFLNEGSTVYPLMVNRSKSLNANGNIYDLLKANSDDELLMNLEKAGKDSITASQSKTPQWLLDAGAPYMPDRMHYVSVKPYNFRSRFAAFDPMKKESSNLLAQFGALAPTATMAAYLYNQERNKGGKQ